MASPQKYAYPFPPYSPHYTPPPPPPPHSPPPQPRPVLPPPPPPPHSPPPHPQPVLPPHSPPPRPHPVHPPPKPHPIAPPPHHLPPPPLPPHHPTVIIIVVVSFGSLLLLGALFLGLCSFLKRRKKKMVRKTEDIDVEGHLRIHEIVVPGPHGPRIEMLDVEGDVEVHDHVRKSEVKVGKELDSSDQAPSFEGKEDAFEKGASSASVVREHDHQVK